MVTTHLLAQHPVTAGTEEEATGSCSGSRTPLAKLKRTCQEAARAVQVVSADAHRGRTLLDLTQWCSLAIHPSAPLSTNALIPSAATLKIGRRGRNPSRACRTAEMVDRLQMAMTMTHQAEATTTAAAAGGSTGPTAATAAADIRGGAAESAALIAASGSRRSLVTTGTDDPARLVHLAVLRYAT